jgi:hypothetical protein
MDMAIEYASDDDVRREQKRVQKEKFFWHNKRDWNAHM